MARTPDILRNTLIGAAAAYAGAEAGPIAPLVPQSEASRDAHTVSFSADQLKQLRRGGIEAVISGAISPRMAFAQENPTASWGETIAVKETAFGQLRGFPKEVRNQDKSGKLNFDHPDADLLSAFFDTLTPEIQQHALGSTPGNPPILGVNETPVNGQVYKVGRIKVSAADEKTPATGFNIGAREGVLITGGEVDDVTLFAVHNGANVGLTAVQIDNMPGTCDESMNPGVKQTGKKCFPGGDNSVINPQDVTLVIFTGEDPGVSIAGLRPERNRLTKFEAPTAKFNPDQMMNLLKISGGNYRNQMIFINAQTGAYLITEIIVGPNGGSRRNELNWNNVKVIGTNMSR